MTHHYDIIVIGAGPAGYHAAIRSAQLGFRVACVDRALNDQGHVTLGGTCLRVGCVPSKALLDSSKLYWHLRHLSDHGITVHDPLLDLAVMQARKERIVNRLTAGIAQLFREHHITIYTGHAVLHPQRQIVITRRDGSQLTIDASNVILAPGAETVPFARAPIDGRTIVDSAGALTFREVPEHLVVIGAGVIGLELGSVWRRLGAQVTLLEAQSTLLAGLDRELVRLAARSYAQQGLVIRLGATVQQTTVDQSAGKPDVKVTYTDSKGSHRLHADKLLVAVGRRPATATLLAHNCGVRRDSHGHICVDDYHHTGVDGVWAIGDCIPGPMLAHKGFKEGIAVAERIAGLSGEIALDALPWVIYTEPELAWVGQTEQALTAQGIAYRSGTFPFSALARAAAMGEPTGMVKIIAQAQTNQLLGIHLIGANASELIHEGVLGMHKHGAAIDLANMIHAHPTLSEALGDAAMALQHGAIHGGHCHD